MRIRFVLKTLSSVWFRWLYRKKFVFQGEGPKINGFCVVKASMIIGNNCHFNGFRALGSGKVLIGQNFHSGYGLVFLTSNHDYKGSALPYDMSVVSKNVVISENVWVGINVLFLPGVKVGEGAIIQAGSVVSKSIPDFAIAGGNPAEVIKYRDIEHYASLKESKSFV